MTLLTLKLGNDNNVDEMLGLERRVWPPEIQATRESFQARLTRFPEGVVAAYARDRLVGLTTSMIINWRPGASLESWEVVTDTGSIKNHQAGGDSLYIVSIGAERSPDTPGIGAALIQEQISLGQRLGLTQIVLGSRVPGYHAWRESHGGDIDEYISKTSDDGYSVDPLIRFFSRQGLAIQRIVPDYMKSDHESLNYGVIMSRAL